MIMIIIILGRQASGLSSPPDWEADPSAVQSKSWLPPRIRLPGYPKRLPILDVCVYLYGRVKISIGNLEMLQIRGKIKKKKKIVNDA